MSPRPIPSDHTDVVRILHGHAERLPGRHALTFLEDGETEAERVTYGRFDERVRAIAAVIQERGIAGERVLLLHPPGVEFAAAFFACLYAGAVAVPSPPPMSNRAVPRVESIAADCTPALVLTTTEIAAKTRDQVAKSPVLSALPWQATDEIPSAMADQWALPALAADDLAFLQYTSGSTAAPKGVMVSHGNLLANMRMIEVGTGHTSETPMLTWLPMYHDMGLIGNLIQPLYVGTHCVFMPPIRFIQKPVRWLKAVTKHRPHTSGGPNFAFDLCVRNTTEEERAGLDLRSWRVAFNGAEPVQAHTLRDFSAAFAGCGFRAETHYPNYGLAEGTLIVSGGRKTELPVVKAFAADDLDRHLAVSARPEDPAARLLVSSGRTILDQEIVIVDPDSATPCADRRIGEIWVAGGNVARGYWNKELETQRDFNARTAGGRRGPFLRTGDLGFLDGGELFVTGRLKDLIIIHGRNVYPQDIELTAEHSHEALVAAGGAAFHLDEDGEERVVLVQEITRHFRKYDLEKVSEAVRAAVWDELEVTLHDVVLVKPGSNPKTSSGKIMRHAVKNRYLAGELPVVWCGEETVEAPFAETAAPAVATAPAERHDLHAYLRGKVAAALKVPAAGIDAGRAIHTLGLDSLNAAMLAHQVETELGVTLPITTFMQDHSLDDLAEELGRRVPQTARKPSMRLRDLGSRLGVPRGEEPQDRTLCMTRGQRALWFQQQLMPESPAFNVALSLRVRGPIDGEALNRTLGDLAARHPLLRARLVRHNGEPQMRIRHQVDFAPDTASLRKQSSHAALRAIIDEARIPFNLDGGDLVRATLFELGDDDHVLVVCLHHIICDGWSINLFLDDFCRLYQAATTGVAADLAPATPYENLLAWQEGGLSGAEGTADLAFWRRALENAPSHVDLPIAGKRPAVQTFNGESRAIDLPADLVERVRALAQETGATPFIVLQGLLQVLLYRYSGHADVPVGTIMAGRPGEGFARTLGYFVNPVVLRTPVRGEESFRALIARVRVTVREAIEHQGLPFAVLVEQLNPRRDASRSPMFQIATGLTKLNVETDQGFRAIPAMDGATRVGDLRIMPFALPQQEGQFDLNWEFFETPGRIFGFLYYNADLFSVDAVTQLVGHFQSLLTAALAEPDAAVDGLRVLTAEDEAQLDSWNRQSRHLPDPASFRDRCLHGLIEEQVARTPAAIAVQFEDQTITYAALNARANQLARHLAAQGAGPDRIVAVFAERSIEMIVGMLAVLKSGAAYLPLDADAPPERTRFMLEDAAVPVVLTLERLTGRLPDTAAAVFRMDADWGRVDGLAGGDLDSAVTAENLAYVIYTSGSTGRPKAVLIPHAAVCPRLRWIEATLGASPSDRFMQSGPHTFDPSLMEIFTPLISGGRLVLPVAGGQKDAAYLVDLILNHGITAFATVPALLQLLVEEPRLRDSRLRHVITGGEALPAALQNRFMELTGAVLHNLYGPTETTIFATHWACRPMAEDAQVPIGEPVAHAQVHILDANRQRVPVGVPGEIYVGGAGLARGYLNQPEMTEAAFVQVPHIDGGGRLYRTGDLGCYDPDGVIRFLGRADSQVKIRGFRVEPGEIEAHLQSSPDIKEAAVVAERDHNGTNRLAAFVVAEGHAVLDTHRLREWLARDLPDYMVPAIFVVMDKLPRTVNDKVDRAALPSTEDAPRPLRAERVAPRNPLERRLVHIWESVLKVSDVGIRDNFFELGGNSLMALRILAQAERELDIHLSATTLLQNPTVESMALHLRGQDAGPVLDTIVELNPPADGRNIFCVAPGHGDVIRLSHLAEQLKGAHGFYALVPPRAGASRQSDSDLETLARQYISQIKSVQRSGPYVISGFSLGGVVAYEIARQLRERGDRIAALVLLDTVYPSWPRTTAAFFNFFRNFVDRAGRPTFGGLAQWLYTVFADKGLEMHLNAVCAAPLKPYSGPLTLVMTRVNARLRWLLFRNWRKVARAEIETLRVGGWHGRMFRDPYVRELARVLRDSLR